MSPRPLFTSLLYKYFENLYLVSGIQSVFFVRLLLCLLATVGCLPFTVAVFIKKIEIVSNCVPPGKCSPFPATELIRTHRVTRRMSARCCGLQVERARIGTCLTPSPATGFERRNRNSSRCIDLGKRIHAELSVRIIVKGEYFARHMQRRGTTNMTGDTRVAIRFPKLGGTGDLT